MIKTEGYISVENVQFGRNARYIRTTEHLYSSVLENGIQKPILVEQDTNVVIQGNCRAQTVLDIVVNHPDAAKAHAFDTKGIPCVYVEGTPAELAGLRIDHNDQRPLGLDCEVQAAFNDLLDHEFGKKEVVDKCSVMIDMQNPLEKAVRDELDFLKSEKGYDAYLERLWKARYGFFQPRYDVWRLPVVVAETLRYFEVGGDLPEGIKSESELPKLKSSDHAKLWKELKEDIATKDPESGLAIFSKQQPGPRFNAKWKALVERTKKAAAKKGTASRKMSANEIKEQAEKLESQTLKRLSLEYAGDKDVVKVTKEMDEDVRDLELTKAYDPEMFKRFKKNAKRLRKEEAKRLEEKREAIKKGNSTDVELGKPEEEAAK